MMERRASKFSTSISTSYFVPVPQIQPFELLKKSEVGKAGFS